MVRGLDMLPFTSSSQGAQKPTHIQVLGCEHRLSLIFPMLLPPLGTGVGGVRSGAMLGVDIGAVEEGAGDEEADGLLPIDIGVCMNAATHKEQWQRSQRAGQRSHRMRALKTAEGQTWTWNRQQLVSTAAYGRIDRSHRIYIFYGVRLVKMLVVLQTDKKPQTRLLVPPMERESDDRACCSC
jgi:hypothetical protein